MKMFKTVTVQCTIALIFLSLWYKLFGFELTVIFAFSIIIGNIFLQNLNEQGKN